MSVGAKRVPFDEYEAAILLDGYLKVADGRCSRNDAVADVSKSLRNIAAHRGLEIDKSYRSEAGIRSQMDRMQAALEGDYSGPHIPKLFCETVERYLEANDSYKETLNRALVMAGAPSGAYEALDSTSEPRQVTDSICASSSQGDEGMVCTVEDENLLSRYPLLFKRVYASLRRLSMDYSQGVDSSQVYADVRGIGRVSDIERILAHASWSELREGFRYRFLASRRPGEDRFEASEKIQNATLSPSRQDAPCVKCVENRIDYKVVLLEDLGFTKGRRSALRRAGVETLYDLVELRNSGRLNRIPGFGPKAMGIVENILLNADSLLLAKRDLLKTEADFLEEDAAEAAESASDEILQEAGLSEAQEVASITDAVELADAFGRDCFAENRDEYKDIPLYELNFDRLLYSTLRGEGLVTLYDLIESFNAGKLPLSYSVVRESYGYIASVAYRAGDLPAVRLLLPDLEPLDKNAEQTSEPPLADSGARYSAENPSASCETEGTSLLAESSSSVVLDSELSRILQEGYGLLEDEIPKMLVDELSDFDKEGVGSLQEGSLHASTETSSSYHLVVAPNGSSCIVSVGSEGVRIIPSTLMSEDVWRVADCSSSEASMPDLSGDELAAPLDDSEELAAEECVVPFAEAHLDDDVSEPEASESLPILLSAAILPPDEDESDMDYVTDSEEAPSDLLGRVTKVFRENPLLGNVILSEEDRARVIELATKAVTHRLESRGSVLDSDEELLVTIAVIELAKTWDYSDEAGFWLFVSNKFGFMERDDAVRKIVCDSLKSSFERNNRWLIMERGEHRYVSTILVHALAPTRSLIDVFDFLYDFYSANLGGVWDEDEDIVLRMTYILQDRLKNYDDDESSLLRVDASSYRFYSGIKKLVKHRPRFAAKLFCWVIARIDLLAHGVAVAPATRVQQLCDSWWSKARDDRRARENGSSRDGAVEISRLRPAYQLDADGKVWVALPDVRIGAGSIRQVELAFFVDGTAVYRLPMRRIGNEFGWTACGVKVGLFDLASRGAVRGLDVCFQLVCDGRVAYDSAARLRRDFLLFAGGREIDPSSCEPRDCVIVVPSETSVDGTNVALSRAGGDRRYDVLYAELNVGFVLRVNGEVVAVDSQRIEASASIKVDKRWAHVAEYVLSGRRYDLVPAGSSIVVEMTELDGSDSFAIFVNGAAVECDVEPGSNGKTMVGFLPKGVTGAMSIVLLNRRGESETVIGSKRVYAVSSFDWAFNRPFYYSPADYDGARLRCAINGCSSYVGFGRGDACASVEHDGGSIECLIPKITLGGSGANWGGDALHWAGSLSEEYLAPIVPDGVRVDILVDDVPVVRRRSGRFPFGRKVSDAAAQQSDREWIRVYLELSAANSSHKKKYLLCKASPVERFAVPPELELQEGVLTWNGGGSFLGSRSGSWRLFISKEDEVISEHPLSLDEAVVATNISLEDGEYGFSIVRSSGNVFNPERKVIAEGAFFAGDRDALRFAKRRIVIDAATFEADNGGIQTIHIEPVYVEGIRFVGRRRYSGENVDYPTYEGTAYGFIGNGLEAYASHEFVDRSGHRVLALNPVRIEYLNDSAVCIKSGKDDIPYCYRSKVGRDRRWRMTDRDIDTTDPFNRGKYDLICPITFSYTTDKLEEA